MLRRLSLRKRIRQVWDGLVGKLKSSSQAPAQTVRDERNVAGLAEDTFHLEEFTSTLQEPYLLYALLGPRLRQLLRRLGRSLLLMKC